MTVKKQVNGCKCWSLTSQNRTVNGLVVLKERPSGGSCALHVVADLHHTLHSARNQSRVRPFTVSSLNRKTPATFMRYTPIFNAPHTHNRVG